MDLPLDPVGNLEILFWVYTSRGGIILEKLKKFNFPHMDQDEGSNPFAARFAARFAQFFCGFLGRIWILFLAERSEASQRVNQPTGAKQPTTS